MDDKSRERTKRDNVIGAGRSESETETLE